MNSYMSSPLTNPSRPSVEVGLELINQCVEHLDSTTIVTSFERQQIRLIRDATLDLLTERNGRRLAETPLKLTRKLGWVFTTRSQMYFDAFWNYYHVKLLNDD